MREYNPDISKGIVLGGFLSHLRQTLMLRNPIDVIRAGLWGAGFYFLFVDRINDSWKFIVAAIAATILRSLGTPKWYDLGFCLALVLQVTGNTWHLFENIQYFDKLVHTFLPLFGAPALYFAFARLGVFPKEIENAVGNWRFRLFLVVAMLGITAATFWEMTEFTAEQVLHVPLQHGNADTITDLMFSTFGSAIGGFLVSRTTRR